MIKWISKFIEWTLNILIVFIVILLISAGIYVFQIKGLNKDYADIFGYTIFEVATGSMSPTINIGDVIIVKVTKDVKLNEIIVFKEGKSFITHRLIKADSDIIVTKGDANNSSDKNITQDLIVGQVIKIIPNVGIWKKVLSTKEVLILVAIIIILFGFVFASNGLKENKNKKEDEKPNNKEIKKEEEKKKKKSSKNSSKKENGNV